MANDVDHASGDRVGCDLAPRLNLKSTQPVVCMKSTIKVHQRDHTSEAIAGKQVRVKSEGIAKLSIRIHGVHAVPSRCALLGVEILVCELLA